MRPVLLLVALALAALAYPAVTAAGPKGSDSATMCVLTTQLRAGNEVPASTAEAFGSTQIKIRNDGTIEYRTHLVNPGGETFVAGHIHVAPAGVAGPVVQSLLFPGPDGARQIRDGGEVSNPTLGAAICADPSAYYVNYHTTLNPGGAARGQLG